MTKEKCLKCKWCITDFEESFCDNVVNYIIDRDEDGLAIAFYYQNIKDISDCLYFEDR